MSTFKILEGKDHNATYWNPIEVNTKDWYNRRFKIPITMGITMESFAKASKEIRNEFKNVESFVGAESVSMDRQKNSIKYRTLITLDLDHCDLTTVDKIKAVLSDYEYILHSTASSTIVEPRYRLIISQVGIVDNIHYEPLCRIIMSEIGIDYFDTTCVEINRLFYYPAIPEGGTYDVWFNEGKPLIPNEWLAKYDDWKDISTWVYSERETERIKKELGTYVQQNPKEKSGYIGAFCRIYDIHSVIALYLSDKYEGGDKADRYTFIGGTSINGLQIYNDDMFAYSYQESDPCSRALNNSFDLVRKHLYANDDEKQSVKNMIEFCKKDSIVVEEWKRFEGEKKDEHFSQMFNDEKVVDDLYARPYVIEKNNKFSVGTACLTEYIRNNEHFITCRSLFAVLRYWYKDGCYRLISDEEFKGYIKELIPKPIRQSKYTNEVFADLTTDLNFIKFEELNTFEHLINFKNGLLDINTMELQPHTPKLLSTIQLPFNYKDMSNSRGPVFEKFINHLVEDDMDVRQLLIECVGVVISNVKAQRMKKALFMVGKGDVGKSTLKRFICNLIGIELQSSIDLCELEDKFGGSELYGKMMGGSNDITYTTIKELKIFKKATGGDLIRAEFKGKTGFDFYFNGLLWFIGNRMPRFGGDKGEHMYKRCMIVECNNVVEKIDPLLDEKLLAEKEYIAYQAIMALKQLIQRGYEYTEPEKCKEHLKAYEIENDSIRLFYKECCVNRTGIKDNCTCKTIYDVYGAWCKDNCNGFKETKQTFNTTLKNVNKTVKTVDGYTYWREFTLNEETKNDYRNFIRQTIDM
jgi:P4 family phage/plasmid primase-like protien